jgi:hypothetical protein
MVDKEGQNRLFFILNFTLIMTKISSLNLESVLKEIEVFYSPAVFKTWFRHTRLTQLKPDVAEIGVDNEMAGLLLKSLLESGNNQPFWSYFFSSIHLSSRRSHSSKKLKKLHPSHRSFPTTPS